MLRTRADKGNVCALANPLEEPPCAAFWLPCWLHSLDWPPFRCRRVFQDSDDQHCSHPHRKSHSDQLAFRVTATCSHR